MLLTEPVNSPGNNDLYGRLDDVKVVPGDIV